MISAVAARSRRASLRSTGGVRYRFKVNGFKVSRKKYLTDVGESGTIPNVAV